MQRPPNCRRDFRIDDFVQLSEALKAKEKRALKGPGSLLDCLTIRVYWVQAYKRTMDMKIGKANARTRVSGVLAEIRNSRHGCIDHLSPGNRMELAFLLSMDALKFFRAGLRAQGFSEAEIRRLVRSRRR